MRIRKISTSACRKKSRPFSFANQRERPAISPNQLLAIPSGQLPVKAPVIPMFLNENLPATGSSGPAHQTGILAAFLAPHPPIIIPAVGHGSHEADRTIAALQQAAADLAALQPDSLIVISPHAPMFSDFVYFYGGDRLSGNFAQFGHPQSQQEWPADTELADAIIAEITREGLSGGYLPGRELHRHGPGGSLDHGVLVPLYYLAAQTPGIRLVALSSSDLPADDIFRLGQAIARATAQLGRRAILIASGDLSHKANENSPYGSCPEGAQFDSTLMAAIQTGDLGQILAIDSRLRERAAECGYRSLIALCGAFSNLAVETYVYHYEAPYGIGYGVARFIPAATARPESDQPMATRSANPVEPLSPVEPVKSALPPEHSIPVTIAIHTLEHYLRQHHTLTPADLAQLEPALDLGAFSSQRAGAFVSLHKHGQLRGCIGTTGPTTANVVTEIIQNAISAAIHDPRFDPVRAAELPDLEISVDILEKAEPVTDRSQLDPRIYGVIVRDRGRTGLLLPDLDGVDTVADQLAIACRKAGIAADEPFTIERFRVIRYE
ncbi:MAG: AmmeMemoRadiSam system protein A [Clostridia bacterium]|nr:AmmeMemoRadiSam system protein A [Clostridia bacterium]